MKITTNGCPTPTPDSTHEGPSQAADPLSRSARSVLGLAIWLATLTTAAPLLCLAAEDAVDTAGGRTVRGRDADVPDSGVNSVEIDGVRFRLADGLGLEKVASEPLVKWPIVADWDPQGRLVVAESGGVGRPILEDNKDRRHRIIRLVDRDGDGVFDERILAAEAVAFPEGVLCLGDDIFVTAPPEIWRFTDADGDGVCERREVWFDGKTLTGCANDLHGPFLGPDGWIYWCKGAFGEQTHRLVGGESITTRASHLFRRRAEGGPVEIVVSGGMDNPVEIAFTPEGEKFFSSTFLHHPGQAGPDGPAEGLRDGIAHAVLGGLHGKSHSVIDAHVRTGELMPVMTDLGPAAPSGIACLRRGDPLDRAATGGDASLGDKDDESRRVEDGRVTDDGRVTSDRVIAAALFNLHKLTAHRLVPDGASFRSVDTDLVATERVDFHPTDVLEDADGSLLLIDTGGWYDLCCPTSRIDQKTASGGIYRVTTPHSRTAAKMNGPDSNEPDSNEPDSNAATAATSTLPPSITAISDRRPWVRREASWRWRASPDEAVRRLAPIVEDEALSLDRRLDALWTLCRVGSPASLRVIAKQLESPQPGLAQAACHAVAVHRFSADNAASATGSTPASDVTGSLERLLNHSNLAVRRASAEALGRVGDVATAADLLAAVEANPGDRHLEHSLLYALVEWSRRYPAEDLLRVADSGRALDAVLLVLDQTDRQAEIGPERLFDALERDDPRLRQTAARMLARRVAWGKRAAESLGRLRDRAAEGDDGAAEILAVILGGWKQAPAVRQWVADWIRDAAASPPAQQARLDELLPAICSTDPVPATWVKPLASWLNDADPEQQDRLCDRFRELRFAANDAVSLKETLTRLARNAGDTATRLRRLAPLPVGATIADPDSEADVVASFVAGDESQVPLASNVLSRVKLSPDAASRLVDDVAKVSPRYLPVAIEAVHRSEHVEANRRLLDALVDVPAAKTLPQAFLSQLYRRDAAPLREQAEATGDALLEPPADVRAVVDRTLKELPEGDPVRGLQVFRGDKAQCSGCHRMGYVGKEIGPILTRIGATRTPEAILEAILFPSARQEQSYQATRVLTVDGQAYSGLVRDETDASVTIQLDAERRVVVPRDEIELMQPSEVSVMPGGIAELLSPQELADLITLLRSAR